MRMGCFVYSFHVSAADLTSSRYLQADDLPAAFSVTQVTTSVLFWLSQRSDSDIIHDARKLFIIVGSLVLLQTWETAITFLARKLHAEGEGLFNGFHPRRTISLLLTLLLNVSLLWKDMSASIPCKTA